jgi:hypothetical protein
VPFILGGLAGNPSNIAAGWHYRPGNVETDLA